MDRKKVFGLMFILIGVVIFLENQNYIEITESIFLWLETVIIGYIVLRYMLKGKILSTFIPLIILFALYNNEYNFIKVSVWIIILVGIFIYVGLLLLFSNDKNIAIDFGRKTKTEDYGNVTSSSVIFGENIRYVDIENIDNFKVTCNFGESDVYFNRTNITNKNFKIDLTVLLGEVTLYIPREWKINNNTTTIFGEMESMPNDSYENNVVVNIDGFITFGEVNIFYI